MTPRSQSAAATMNAAEKSKSKSSYDEGSFKRKKRVKTSNEDYAFGSAKPKKPHKKKLAKAAKGGVKKGSRKSTRKKDRG